MTTRKRKFIVWLSNHADCRDDETITVLAKDKSEATELAKSKFDSNRFSIKAVLTAKEAKANWV